ncbi:glycoside hydrolase family 53 protein [Mucilaginibacter defluvii]|uniref:Arabinogalactan endo-beta-1,4-galactanase n=1 Tax=Mucilaginibacter defluvii TaxID=1196019 RepID=A0ABP9FKS2_9SPHI
MKKNYILTMLVCAGLLAGCNKDISAPQFPDEPINAGFAKGADVSWVSEMEDDGIKFYNSAGAAQDLFTILKGKGMNSIRLRAWVNPTNGYNNTADMVEKAVRAKNAGYRVMLDLHYSDIWADPGNQNKPAAWANLSFAALKTTVGTYTVGVMNALKDKGITPEWVQVGNETNDGMLWNDGKSSVSMKNFAELVNAGYDAVKSVSSSSKVIVHLSNGYDNNLYRWMFDGLKTNGAKWDVIGMSLYPTASTWQNLNKQCLANMNDMVTRYGSEVMLCEVGMPATEAAASKAFLTDIILKTNSVDGKKGLGVFYWEPQSYNDWEGYKLGAFDASGKPTIALDAFLIEKF